ncbi:MAG TPA: NAD(P)/FAD-dependent oxidoreductase [Candidatus Scatovivens faecipullorum]|nr:NAD(P)/FAD-dependent oxidoreductase [Candidatus Scatovivens faecipullorum]
MIMKVIVIGGGPAGIISAISSARNGDNVILIEKNNSLGKKLLITGKGRCNITSSIDISDFIKNVPGNGKFLYSAFQNFTNIDIIKLIEENGIKVKEERGNRIFPVTDNAKDVLMCFEKELRKYKNIEIRLNTKVKEILEENKEVMGILLESGEKLLASKVIIATGGKSYPLTGSTGDGYKMASKLGHTVEKIRGSLVPLTADKILCQSMQGLSLRNVKIQIKDLEKNKKIYEDFGEMLFTHFGISGPTILSSSAHLLRYKEIDRLLKENKIKLIIDLKPALSEEELDKRIRRDFEEFINKEFKNSLEKLLPKKMIESVINLSGINPIKKVNEITKEERKNLVNLIKNFEVSIAGFRPVEEAIVTAGGISVKEINPKTMESKLVKGLYFAGEVIDVDAYTGGFNLQIAYSTGYTAGLNN